MSNAPEITVLADNDETNGRHRKRLHRGATAVTAVIAAGAVAMATYAGLPSSAPSMDASGIANSLGDATPYVGDAALQNIAEGREASLTEAVAAVEEQAAAEQAAASNMNFSAWSARKGGDAAIERSGEIAAERAAAEQAAEQAAAEQAAAEQAAAERAEQEEAAARSQERAEAPVEEAPVEEAAPEPAPEPAPAPAPSGSPRDIAAGMLGNYGWGQDQFSCLNSLWNRESGWNTYAQNPSSGAYGIPQSLPGSKMASAGSDWQTNPATQIRWGLGYIQGRYGSPCGAWAHSQSVGWY